MMKAGKKRVGLAVALFSAVTAFSAGSADAGALVASRSALIETGTSTIDWGSVGTPFTLIPDQTTVTSSGTGAAITTQVSGSGIRLDQSPIFGNALGNFATGDHLYVTTKLPSDDFQPVTLTFSTMPLRGVGTEIQAEPALGGSFSAFLDTYDSLGNLIDHFVKTGGSTFFLGVRNDSPDIARVTIGLYDTNNDRILHSPFAINQVTLLDDPAPAPEPSTLVSGALACLAALGYGYRHRRSIA